MKNAIIVIVTLLLFVGSGASILFAQDLSFDYQYNSEKKEHYVVNIPKDSTYLQWGIWLNVSEPQFSFHTMKLFLKKDQALYLEHFHGIAEIILDNDNRIPISVFWFENTLPEYDQFDKVLAYQFNKEESNILLDHSIKKIVFYTSYGRFNVKFANKDLVAKALHTLKYNVAVFNKTQNRLLTQRIQARSPF